MENKTNQHSSFGLLTPGRPNACAYNHFSAPFHAPTWGLRRPERRQHREERKEAADA
jgi:hypothetical protein